MTAAGVDKTALAKELGISYQAVRKVLEGGKFSAENNAKAARFLKVSSDWLATGAGPQPAIQQPSDADAAAPPPPGPTFEELTPEDWRFVRNYLEIKADEEAARDLFEMVEDKAAKMRAMKEKWLKQAGINVPPARHAADAKKTEIARAALDVTEQLRQRSLLEDDQRREEGSKDA